MSRTACLATSSIVVSLTSLVMLGSISSNPHLSEREHLWKLPAHLAAALPVEVAPQQRGDSLGICLSKEKEHKAVDMAAKLGFELR